MTNFHSDNICNTLHLFTYSHETKVVLFSLMKLANSRNCFNLNREKCSNLDLNIVERLRIVVKNDGRI